MTQANIMSGTAISTPRARATRSSTAMIEHRPRPATTRRSSLRPSIPPRARPSPHTPSTTLRLASTRPRPRTTPPDPTTSAPRWLPCSTLPPTRPTATSRSSSSRLRAWCGLKRGKARKARIRQIAVRSGRRGIPRACAGFLDLEDLLCPLLGLVF